MAELLRVTTPVVNKNQPAAQSAPAQTAGVLNVQNTARVLQTHNQTNLTKDGNAGLNNSSAPAMLLNLLKDPAVAASYLKNISFLEEIFKLLPANNRSMTAEIKQMFGDMMMQEGEIAPEMMRQGETATALRGELFDFLRALNDQPTAGKDLAFCVANFLRAANGLRCRPDIRGAVCNNLRFLQKSFSTSREISSALKQLVSRLAQPEEKENFAQIKKEITALIKQMESSILFNEKTEKVLSILKYNLSRYSTDETYYHESALLLSHQLNGQERRQFRQLADRFLKQMLGGQDAARTKGGQSRVMSTLTQLLGKHAASENLSPGDEAKIEQILHSLLSSPCNFTPLLHFVVPVVHQGWRSFAEIWVNPDSDEKDMPAGVSSGVHFLLVIDSEAGGRFEADVYVHENVVDFHLFCPPGLESFFAQMADPLARTFARLNYQAGDLSFSALEKPRSLMEVFKSLPYKRMGLDVKI